MASDRLIHTHEHLATHARIRISGQGPIRCDEDITKFHLGIEASDGRPFKPSYSIRCGDYYWSSVGWTTKEMDNYPEHLADVIIAGLRSIKSFPPSEY